MKDRKVFGQAVGNYQNTRYTLAELQTEVQEPAVPQRETDTDACAQRRIHRRDDGARSG